uniref:ATPase AAA-type core domain-containing protein n=1 Tax=Populus alba TaxID=43335 RepID=A0A4U5Q821_POPAL|nr:hypothetical protein D5086_0000127480 [Populus alba]
MVYQYAVIVYFYFSIGRLESIKQALYELVILPLRKPELFSHEKLLGPRKGDVIAVDVRNPDHNDVEFELIGVLESIQQALYELVILPLRKPELFSHEKLLGPQKGILLYGPPGTGKTMLAKAIVRDPGAVFINVRISNLMSKWFADAQKLGEYRSHLNCLSCA